jgi:hypothetical protein
MGQGGIGTVKIDRGDTKVIVQQLSRLEGVKNDTEKLKRLVALKMDKADGERALSIRITREEFFSMLTTIFPSNTAIQRAMAGPKKKLPPIEDDGKVDQSGRFDVDDELSVVRHRRQIHTAGPQPLMPARGSRLLALNQKYLKGADGRYYIKDIGADPAFGLPNVVGSQSNMEVSIDQAFDFQPFLPASGQEPERIRVPSHHRTRLPTEEM